MLRFVGLYAQPLGGERRPRGISIGQSEDVVLRELSQHGTMAELGE